MPRTLAGQTARQLRRDIIQGNFQPGERLTFDRLSKAYAVGSSPLREALFQVATEGLVHGEEHKGFVVAPINLGEMMDVSSLRAHLEMHAVAKSIAYGDEDWETQLVGAKHRLSRAQRAVQQASGEQRLAAENDWEQRHREFHYALCSACGSPWLLHFFDQLYDQLERYRRYFWKYAERVQIADDEHERIVRSALARDTEGTVALLKEHFERQARMTADVMQAMAAKPRQAGEAAGSGRGKRGAGVAPAPAPASGSGSGSGSATVSAPAAKAVRRKKASPAGNAANVGSAANTAGAARAASTTPATPAVRAQRSRKA